MDKLAKECYKLAEHIIEFISDDKGNDRDTFSHIIYIHTQIQITKALNAAADRAVELLGNGTSAVDNNISKIILNHKI